MSKYMLLKLGAIVCVIALLACGLTIFYKTAHIGLNYANAEAYTAGGAELDSAVKNLDIHWTDGEVNIAYHAKDTIEISETASKPISEDTALRWWLDGDTLRIQYAKSGFSLRRLFSFSSLDKVLTVTLPEGIELGSVAIDAASGNVNVPDLLAGSVKVDLASGDLALKLSGAAESVELSTTSGNISADVSEVEKLRVDVTSGDIQAALENAREVSLSTTSGNIALSGGNAHNTRVDSTSGKVSVTLTAFDDLKIDVTSGNVTAALPSEPGYRADIETTSGSFDYTVALARDGGDYTCGDGSARLHIDTTSGNIRLEDMNER